jgi:hypothetical protein
MGTQLGAADVHTSRQFLSTLSSRMDSVDLNAIGTFIEVVRAGGFSAAGRRAGCAARFRQ